MALITTFSDFFSRADAANLGANWDADIGEAVTIVSNRARVTTIGVTAGESLNAVAMQSNQWARIVIPTFSGNSAAIATLYLRSTFPTVGTWYEFAANFVPSTYSSRIVYRLAGSNTTQVTELATTWLAGDIMRAEAVGSSLNLYRNADVVPTVTMTDGNLTSGRVGFALLAGDDSAGFEISSFESGYFYTARPSGQAVSQAVNRSGAY